MKLFEKPCERCGDMVFGPRLGGKARGQWLGYDLCLKCRQSDKQAAENPNDGQA